MNKISSYFLKTVLAAAALVFSLSTPAASNDKIKLGMPAKMFLNLVEYVAADQGFFKKNSLDVDFVQIADSSIPVRALISKDLMISQTGMSETLAAIDKGATLVTIGGVHTGLHYAMWVNREASIKDVRDLVGKKVGISSPGSLPHVVIVALMRQAGISEADIGKVKWVSLKGSSARINGVINGTIDATVASFDPKAAHAPTVQMLFVVSKKLPEFVMTPWDVRVESLTQDKDVLKRFITAELEATRWIFNNKKQALEIAKKHFDYSSTQLDEFYTFYTDGGVWNPNGMVTSDQAEYMQKINVEGKLQRSVLPAAKVLDTSLLKEVLAKIGEYKK